MFFIKFGDYSHCFFWILLMLLSLSSIFANSFMCLLVHIMMSHIFLRICSYFSFLFIFTLYFWLENLYWSIFSFTEFTSVSSNLLSLAGENFTLIFVLFNSRISMCCHLSNFISLLMFFFDVTLLSYFTLILQAQFSLVLWIYLYQLLWSFCLLFYHMGPLIPCLFIYLLDCQNIRDSSKHPTKNAVFYIFSLYF